MNNSETIIKPGNSWLRIDWREIWSYHDLLLLIVRRDFVSRFKQTILGPVWFIFQPLVLTVVFTLVFNRVAKIPTDGLPPVLFYMCGLVGWNFFSHSFNNIADTFRTNAHLFGKVYFPRLIVPLAMIASNFIAFCLQLVAFAVLYVYYKYFTGGGHLFGLSQSILLFPVVVAQIGLISMGVGLIFASLTAKYRDLSHTLGFVIQVWLYATPVIYPVSGIPEIWRGLLYLNPMCSVVESLRLMFLGQSSVSLIMVMASLAVTLLLYIVGVLAFNRVQRTFIDTV